MILDGVESGHQISLPAHINSYAKETPVLAEFNQRQIMQVIGLAPPFLKIQKIIILGKNNGDPLQSKCIGIGLTTQADTKGHYNHLISLALCGQLMASTAAIHLAVLFPKTAPQAIEVNGVKPTLSAPASKTLWKPSEQGTYFFTESSVLKKRLQLVYTTTKISFGNLPYGSIEQIKFFLLPSKTLSSAIEFPAE